MRSVPGCGHCCCPISTNTYHVHLRSPATCPLCASGVEPVEHTDPDHAWFTRLLALALARRSEPDQPA